MSERTNNPERIYLEPPPYSPEGRQWCADDVWPLDGDGPGGVEYVRADLAALLRTPRGEGEADAYLVEKRGDGSWVRVDTYPTLEAAKGIADACEAGGFETRIIPLYRAAALRSEAQGE